MQRIYYHEGKDEFLFGSGARSCQYMARDGLRISGLCQDHAPRCSGRNPDSLGFSEYAVQFLCQHGWDASALSQQVMTPTSFDDYAENYDETLAQGLAVSGEDSSYFARGRVLWLRDCLQQLGEKPRAILDYGCGTGSTAPLFHELLCADVVVGLDSSAQLIERPHQKYGSERSRFLQIDQYQPIAQVDLAYCNGVFYHIPVSKRDQVVAYIARTLRPGELFALWENNP